MSPIYGVTTTETLSQIPDAKPPFHSLSDWKNPMITVLPDGIHIRGVEKPVQVGQLLAALADLPRSSWPYGRVIAYSPFPGLSISGIGLEEGHRRAKEVEDILDSVSIHYVLAPSA